jgi:capsular exopolysaccharide synthesis family protein
MQTEPTPYQFQSTEQGHHIKSEIRKYLRFWYWFVLGVVLAFVGAYLYLRYTPKVYNSNAKIKILNKTKGLEMPSAAFVFNRSNINLENEIEILKSYRIMEQVVRRLDLTMQFYEEGNILTAELDKLPFEVVKKKDNDSILSNATYEVVIAPNAFEVTLSGSNTVRTFEGFNTMTQEHGLPFELKAVPGHMGYLTGKTYLIRFAPVMPLAKGLKNRVNVTMLGKSSDLLQLSLNGQNRAKSENILNTLIDVFNEDGIYDRQEISRRTISFIDERFLLLANELDSIELSLKDYKQDNNFVNIETDAQLGISQRTVTEQELFNMENQMLLARMLKETLSQPEALGLLPANIGLTSSNINNLITEYNTLVLERDKLALSAGSNNPAIKSYNDGLYDVRQNIALSIDNYLEQLSASKAQIEGRNRRYASQVYSLPAKEKMLRTITRQQEIKQSLYLFLLQKREEAAINLAITEPSIKVVEYALSGGMPISPNRRNVYLMAVVAGLLLPFGAMYLYFMLDTKIKGREDLAVYGSKIPVLAEMPKIKEQKSGLIFSNPEDRSSQAEAFRILSSNVRFILPVTDGKAGKVIFSTSSIKGEGKTHVAMNLSLALASINKKVLLIGADLRNPQLHGLIEADKNQTGLTNYLHESDVDWKDALITAFAKQPHHHILISGSIPPNPASLLTNGRFDTLIAEAKKLYDYIVVDTAPTILVTDTVLISHLADATMYVVRANYTEKALINFSKDLSESGKIKNMAYVLNGVPVGRGYGYGYNYGYDYGYGAKG